MRLPPHRTLDIPKVRPTDRVCVLRAKHLPGSPEAVRIFCISCWPIPQRRQAFHIATEAASFLYKKGACKRFSATVHASDPLVVHSHSSSSSTITNAGIRSWYGGVYLSAARHVHFPSIFMRQYSFAMLQGNSLVYINLSHQASKIKGRENPRPLFFGFLNSTSVSGRITSAASSATNPIFFRCLYTYRPTWPDLLRNFRP